MRSVSSEIRYFFDFLFNTRDTVETENPVTSDIFSKVIAMVFLVFAQTFVLTMTKLWNSRYNCQAKSVLDILSFAFTILFLLRIFKNVYFFYYILRITKILLVPSSTSYLLLYPIFKIINGNSFQ